MKSEEKPKTKVETEYRGKQPVYKPEETGKTPPNPDTLVGWAKSAIKGRQKS